MERPIFMPNIYLCTDSNVPSWLQHLFILLQQSRGDASQPSRFWVQAPKAWRVWWAHSVGSLWLFVVVPILMPLIPTRQLSKQPHAVFPIRAGQKTVWRGVGGRHTCMFCHENEASVVRPLCVHCEKATWSNVFPFYSTTLVWPVLLIIPKEYIYMLIKLQVQRFNI